jgi:nitroreductase
MTNSNATMLELLRTRRSLKPDKLAAPGPTAEQLDTILTIGARVPDHKKLAPWRFVIFEGDARAAFGEVFAQACLAEEREPPSPIRLATERGRLMRAPVVVAVISRIVEKPGAPEWEQVLSAGAACYNICLAANAMGYGTCWITEWVSYSPTVRSALDLSEPERIAGFVYMGTPSEKPAERDRPVMSQIVSRWPQS